MGIVGLFFIFTIVIMKGPNKQFNCKKNNKLDKAIISGFQIRGDVVAKCEGPALWKSQLNRTTK